MLVRVLGGTVLWSNSVIGIVKICWSVLLK